MMANQNQTLRKTKTQILSLSEKIMVKNKENPTSGLMLKGDDSPQKPTALSKPVQKQPGY